MGKVFSKLWVKVGLLVLALPAALAHADEAAVGAAVLTQSLEDSPTNETAGEQAIMSILSPSGW